MKVQSYTYTHTHIRSGSWIKFPTCISQLLVNVLTRLWTDQYVSEFSSHIEGNFLIFEKYLFLPIHILCFYSEYSFARGLKCAVKYWLLGWTTQCYESLFLFARYLVALFKHIICLFKKNIQIVSLCWKTLTSIKNSQHFIQRLAYSWDSINVCGMHE